MTTEGTERKFRFGSREEYERELIGLLARGCDEEYEELAEEFVMFMEKDA